jgi:hypothetical protein
MKEWLDRDQENPLYTSHWSAGVGLPAGMFWFDGRCVIAGYGTRAEAWLLDRGAVMLATLRFDAEPAESRRHGSVRAVRPDALVDVPPPNN